MSDDLSSVTGDWVDPKAGKGYASEKPAQPAAPPPAPPAEKPKEEPARRLTSQERAKSDRAANAEHREQTAAARQALRDETKPLPASGRPGMSARDATPQTPRTALDPGSDLNGKSRAAAKLAPRGTDPASQAKDIKETKQALENLGGRTVQKQGDTLETRELKEFPLGLIMASVNGVPTMIRFRFTQQGTPQ